MPAEPLYKKYPELYSYNTETQRHILKSSKVFKRLFKESPQIFVDSQTIIPARSEPNKLPLPPAPELSSPAVHIGAPLPVAKLSLLTNAEVKDDVMRQQVRAMIQEELKQKPQVYQNKNADELSVLFRQMLVAKLLKQDENKVTKNVKVIKPSSTKTKFKFKLQKPQRSDDEEDDSDGFEGEDDD